MAAMDNENRQNPVAMPDKNGNFTGVYHTALPDGRMQKTYADIRPDNSAPASGNPNPNPFGSVMSAPFAQQSAAPSYVDTIRQNPVEMRPSVGVIEDKSADNTKAFNSLISQMNGLKSHWNQQGTRAEQAGKMNAYGQLGGMILGREKHGQDMNMETMRENGVNSRQALELDSKNRAEQMRNLIAQQGLTLQADRLGWDKGVNERELAMKESMFPIEKRAALLKNNAQDMANTAMQNELNNPTPKKPDHKIFENKNRMGETTGYTAVGTGADGQLFSTPIKPRPEENTPANASPQTQNGQKAPEQKKPQAMPPIGQNEVKKRIAFYEGELAKDPGNRNTATILENMRKQLAS